MRKFIYGRSFFPQRFGWFLGILAFWNNARAVIPPEWDIAREQNWAMQITERLQDGEAIWLQSQLGKFLALYQPARGRGESPGAVLILPPPYTHPNSDPLRGIRVALPRSGWHTLSLQLPALDLSHSDYSSLLPAACERLGNSRAWLENRGWKNVAVLGHSTGAAVAAACIAQMENLQLCGVILLSPSNFGTPAGLDLSASLAKITPPILDLYADSKSAAISAIDRAAGRRVRNQPYRQAILPASDSHLAGINDVLIARISGWLQRYCANPPAPQPKTDQK